MVQYNNFNLHSREVSTCMQFLFSKKKSIFEGDHKTTPANDKANVCISADAAFKANKLHQENPVVIAVCQQVYS